jgi:hypothetical protein
MNARWHSLFASRTARGGALVLVALCYWSTYRVWAYGDDFWFLARALDPSAWWRTAAAGHLFRWPEALVNAANVALLGYRSTVLSHAVSLAGFALCALLVVEIARHWSEDDPASAWIAGTVFAVSSCNVSSVTQIDTISQQWSVASVLLLVLWCIRAKQRLAWVRRSVILLIAFMAISWKETAPGALIAVPWACWAVHRPVAPAGSRWSLRAPLLDTAAVVAAMGAYLVLRYVSGAVMGGIGGRYSLAPAVTTVIENAVRIVGCAVYAGSTLDLYPDPRPARLVVHGLMTAWLVCMAIWGAVSLYATRSTALPGSSIAVRAVPALLLLEAASLVPVALTGHASELYSLGVAPFHAILIGILVSRAYGRLFAMRPWTAAGKVVLAAPMALVLIASSMGTREKVSAAIQLSERAERYYEVVLDSMSRVPGQRPQYCWERSSGTKRDTAQYSVFRMPDEDLLSGTVKLASEISHKTAMYSSAPGDASRCTHWLTVREGQLSVRAQDSRAN